MKQAWASLILVGIEKCTCLLQDRSVTTDNPALHRPHTGMLPCPGRREPALLPPPHLTQLCTAAMEGSRMMLAPVWPEVCDRRLLGSGSRCPLQPSAHKERAGSCAGLQGFSANITAPAGTGCWRETQTFLSLHRFVPNDQQV